MLSFNSSCYHNPSTNYRPSPENDIISSTSKLEDDLYSSSLFNFPDSPHMHLEYQDVYRQFLELLYQEQSITAAAYGADHKITAPKMAADSNENATDAAAENEKPTGNQVDHQPTSITRNIRSCKKYGHSKINTALGPRDRRMRLSLDIARKFFDLQDLLGYDKASKTVEWLLRNSGPAIRELARGQGVRGGTTQKINLNPSRELSTCEEDHEVLLSAVEEGGSAATSTCGKIRVRSKKIVKRIVGRATVARESRKRARERARERTSQKRRLTSESIDQEQKLYGELVGFSYSFKESHDTVYDMQLENPTAMEPVSCSQLPGGKCCVNASG